MRKGSKASSSILPIPDLFQVRDHGYFLAFHFNHPWMFQHSPWRRSPRWLLLQTEIMVNSTINTHKSEEGTHQHSMKYLNSPLHLMLFSGSSFNVGVGCRTMYVSRSMRPALGCISVPSAGNGNRCWATSSKVTPNDQTSEVMVYDWP